jgi:hypothetical protein
MGSVPGFFSTYSFSLKILRVSEFCSNGLPYPTLWGNSGRKFSGGEVYSGISYLRNLLVERQII